VPAADVVGAPLTLLAGLWMKLVRRSGVQRLPVSRRILNAVGVFPVRDHYYEPAFHPRHLRQPLDRPRNLPGVDLDPAGQLALLESFRGEAELLEFPLRPPAPHEFGYLNRSFGPGDAEYLYLAIRHFRPRRIIEIGSGNSTLMAEVRFWNEQYVLEARLSGNRGFRVFGALNFLRHDHSDRLLAKCPILARLPDQEPGSFWMAKT